MKLVDLLARELKAWPKMTEGGTRLEQDINNAVIEGDGCGTVELFMLSERADDQKGAHVSKSEWQAAVEALNAPAVWDGKGLPPVGVDCEYRVGGGTWFECNIRYVTKPYIDCPVEVVMFARHLKGEQTGVAGEGEGEVSFRPIRTPEQIAADAREKAVREVYDSCSGQGRSVLEMLGEAYDAGRKQVAK